MNRSPFNLSAAQAAAEAHLSSICKSHRDPDKLIGTARLAVLLEQACEEVVKLRNIIKHGLDAK